MRHLACMSCLVANHDYPQTNTSSNTRSLFLERRVGRGGRVGKSAGLYSKSRGLGFESYLLVPTC